MCGPGIGPSGQVAATSREIAASWLQAAASILIDALFIEAIAWRESVRR